MKNIILLFFLNFLIFNLHSQTTLGGVPMKFSANSANKTISVVDKDDNINIFFISPDLILQHKFNTNIDTIFSKEHVFNRTRFPKLEGYNVDSENNINIYFSDEGHTKFAVLVFNSNGDLKAKTINLNLNKKKRLQSINGLSKFHILTYNKKESSIVRYSFDQDQVTEQAFDFSNEKFLSDSDETTYLGKILKSHENEIIEEKVPTSIEIASKKVKLYVVNDTLKITLNHRKNITRYIEIGLNDSYKNINHFFMPTAAFINDSKYKSNSFIFEKHIFQIICSKNQMVFNIQSIDNKKIINQFSFTSDEEITFINSKIYQDGSAYFDNSTRELELTKQYLRKVSNSDIGVSVFKKDRDLHLTLGAIKEMKGGGAPIMMPMGGVTLGSVGAVSFTITPMMGAYNSYRHTRSVYFRSLLDPVNFKNKIGNTHKNVFDKIADYSEKLERVSLRNDIRFEDVFLYKNHLIFGYYHKKDKMYQLVRFER